MTQGETMKAKFLVLAGAMALAVAACSSEANDDQGAQEPVASETTPSDSSTPSEPSGDQDDSQPSDSGAGGDGFVKPALNALPSCGQIEGMLNGKLSEFVFDDETSIAPEVNGGVAQVSCNWNTKELATNAAEIARYGSVGVAVQIDPVASSFDDLAGLGLAVEHELVSDMGAFLLLPGTDKTIDPSQRLGGMGPQVIAGNVAVSVVGMNLYQTVEDLIPLTVGDGIEVSKDIVAHARANGS